MHSVGIYTGKKLVIASEMYCYFIDAEAQVCCQRYFVRKPEKFNHTSMEQMVTADEPR
jgi:ethanolamine utilization cobalamin adenosyltransferase